MQDLMIYVCLSLSIFSLGLFGMLSSRNDIIIILISLEVVSVALGFLSAIISIYIDDIVGQVFALVLMCAAGAEAAVGLAILIQYYRVRGIISVNFMNSLKG